MCLAAGDTGPFSHALASLADSQYTSSDAFLHACGLLRKLLLNAADPAKRTLRRANPRVAAELLSVAGVEAALIQLGFRDHGDELTITDEAAADVHSAVATVDCAAGSVRRRALVLALRPSDPLGWSAELHDPAILIFNPKFKGAVFDCTPRNGAPSGVIAFHNSPFSNFWPCGAGVTVSHRGMRLRFATSEALLMAFKQHLLAPSGGVPPHESLADALRTQATIRTAAESKEVAARATRRVADYTWWGHHGVHVLVGSVVCLLKFSQDEGLRRLLLSTQGVLLIEAAPHDGAWGVAANSSKALQAPALARTFGLYSVHQSPFEFESREGRVHTRLCCEANALGKALMVARAAILAGVEATSGMELRSAFAAVARHLRLLALPCDWRAAETHLEDSL